MIGTPNEQEKMRMNLWKQIIDAANEIKATGKDIGRIKVTCVDGRGKPGHID